MGSDDKSKTLVECFKYNNQELTEDIASANLDTIIRSENKQVKNIAISPSETKDCAIVTKSRIGYKSTARPSVVSYRQLIGYSSQPDKGVTEYYSIHYELNFGKS